ncbi:hypothetical protein SAMN04488510_12835 [Fervidobacterium changbaicum]|uniref:Uncharacterized protein n=1 Tax=Fervidobacterium changbaicum TaxID=310769 RepID=A0ABX5QSY8_9BACT|nr:hypothetical protein [Fervidobacterium changbaicum]QAV33631.1 hypothetical protein CBS1_07795 [Fervidobacterium changbaicum]SDH72385.1 hypothetical protein SAMN04488510_12835 [Fervidobacterium changbaicum]
MKIFGFVVESYGKYVKVKTSDGEYIIKSEKKAPKEGTKIELKDFGVGDYLAKVLAKKPYNFRDLPSVRFVQLAEELVNDLEFSAKERLIVAIALFLEEVSKRMEMDKSMLQKLKMALKKTRSLNVESSDDKTKENEKQQDLAGFLNYLNVLSGKYGLIVDEGVVFLDREGGTFEVFLKNNRIYGIIQESTLSSSVTLFFEKVPENILELEKRLKDNFNVVSIKLEAMRDGTYV